MNQKLKSILFLLLAAIIWGFAFIAQRVGGELLGDFTFNAIRFLLGALSLIPVICLFENKHIERTKIKATIKPSIITGIILFVATSLQQIGIGLTDFAGKAGFITGFYIVLVPLASLLLYKTKMNLTKWLSVIIALIGLFLVSITSDFTINIGDAIIFVSSFFWTAHILFINENVDKVYALRYSMGQFLTASVLSWIVALAIETFTLEAIYAAALPLLYGGIGSIGIGYTLQILGQKGLNTTDVALVLSTESIFCAIGGVLLLNEVMSVQSYIGCVLMFIGIMLSQVSLNNRKKQLIE